MIVGIGLVLLSLLNIDVGSVFVADDYLGSTSAHLFHFLQVTDLHLTHFGHEDRRQEFELFCNDIVKTLIKPPVTIVSGDLVNSANDDAFGSPRLFQSAQFEEEWKIYADILNRTNITRHTRWLDMRGNHDTFMDADLDSMNSFYRIYSHQGHRHTGSYQSTIRTADGDTYSFVSVDMCARPGLGRPFNINGYVSKKEMQVVSKLVREIGNSTVKIFFGHYPLSVTYPTGLQQLFSSGLVFLNGHLHIGFKHFYIRHSSELLEIELGDWKRKRRFRLLTIDGGLLAFEDYQFGQPIYAVISNPKPAKFKTLREPLHRLKQSSHIRILIFAKRPIVRVDVQIDQISVGQAVRAKKNKNLFILPWNTSLYAGDQLHQIVVTIRDDADHLLTLDHQFSLSLSTISSFSRAHLVLRFHIPTLSLIVLTASLFGYIVLLVYHRYQSQHKTLQLDQRVSRWSVLCSVDLMYYSLVGLAIYHFIGPWYIGYLTEGQFGAAFLWGSVVGGSYLLPDFQYMIGTFQLYLFIYPFTFALRSSCFHRYTGTRRSRVSLLFIYPFVFLTLSSFLVTISFRFSWLISPFGLLLVIFSALLTVQSHRFTRQDFRLRPPAADEGEDKKQETLLLTGKSE